MASVNYNGISVSDSEINEMLAAICRKIGKNINVTSGDRAVPRTDGGKEKSLHLKKRAVDFHIDGLDDGLGYSQIKVYHNWIFSNRHGYEFIWHGPHTETSGQHLHIGRYGDAYLGYVKCKTEGLTAAGSGSYVTEVEIPILFGRTSYIKPPVLEI